MNTKTETIKMNLKNAYADTANRIYRKVFTIKRQRILIDDQAFIIECLDRQNAELKKQLSDMVHKYMHEV